MTEWGESSGAQPAGAAGRVRGGPAAPVADGGVPAAAPHPGRAARGECPTVKYRNIGVH